MDPSVQAAVIGGIAAIIAAAFGLFGRGKYKAKSVQTVRRSLDRQEDLENYVFTLRRQLNSAGRKPHPWPMNLRYLNRDDPDGDADDDA
jgi:hypothetical protein